ncbi:hypothetical protein KEM55_002633, partial [Ascosphaera atra]
MTSTAKASVATYRVDWMRHWAFFVGPPKDDEKFIAHIKGMPGEFEFEIRMCDPRKEEFFHEALELADVPCSKIDDIKEIARQVK